MKRIFYVFLTTVILLFVGCKEENIPTFYSIEGKYSGTYTITQNNYVQKGTVTFNFLDSTYEQDVQIEYPTTGKNSDNGNYSLNDGNYTFNQGRVVSSAVYPAWSLIGSFKYITNKNSLTLSQETSTMKYEIILQKIN